MKFKRFFSAGILAVLFTLISSPARAGIPVIDVTSVAQQIQQVIAWGQQYQQMVDNLTKLQQQFQQLQTMTTKLDGARGLGSILNDPAIQAQLPPEMRNASMLLTNPSAMSTNAAAINSILSSFGVGVTIDPNAGKGNADLFGRAQAILASAQQRQTQLASLAARVDTSPDAKSSLDLLNRNTLETANINNQMVQTMAALESAKQAELLRQMAKRQQFANGVSQGAAAPLKNYTY